MGVGLALTGPLPPLQVGGPPGEVCQHSQVTVLCTGLSLSMGMAVRSQGSGAGGRCGCVCACFRRWQNRTQLAETPQSSSRRAVSRISLGREEQDPYLFPGGSHSPVAQGKALHRIKEPRLPLQARHLPGQSWA